MVKQSYDTFKITVQTIILLSFANGWCKNVNLFMQCCFPLVIKFNLQITVGFPVLNILYIFYDLT